MIVLYVIFNKLLFEPKTCGQDCKEDVPKVRQLQNIAYNDTEEEQINYDEHYVRKQSNQL